MNELRYTIIEKFTTDRLIGKKNQESQMNINDFARNFFGFQ